MAIVNTTHNYVFLAEKHCASRVLRDVLLQQPGSEYVAPHHASYDEVLDACPVASDFAYFSVIRNPADILVTMSLTGSFQDYVRYISSPRERIFFQHVAAADYILRYENLEHDLNAFLAEDGAPPIKLPHKEEYITSLKNPWPAYYAKRDIDFIIKAYPEVTKWGYADTIKREWEEWQLQMKNGSSSS